MEGITMVNDEELTTALWQIAKEDSLASSRIGFPSAATMSRMEAAIKARDQQMTLESRIEGIIEALEGVSQQHYDYRGEVVVDTYLSIKDRLRPKPEEPGFSLPISEAIDFYKERLATLKQTQDSKKPLTNGDLVNGMK